MKNFLKKLTLVQEPDMHIIKVESKDYGIIKFDEGNRKFDAGSKDKGKHSEELGELMNRFKVLGIGAACIENNSIVVADGQHRTNARMKQNKPVYFFISDHSIKDTIISLNTSAKNLSKNDFIHLVATKGNKNFQILESILNEASEISKVSKRKNEIVPALNIFIYSAKPIKRAEAGKVVKNESFTVTKESKKRGDEIVGYIYDMQDNGLKTGLRQSEGLVNLIMELGKKYNHSLMIKNFTSSKQKNIINGMDNVSDITQCLKDIHENKASVIKLKKAA